MTHFQKEVISSKFTSKFEKNYKMRNFLFLCGCSHPFVNYTEADNQRQHDLSQSGSNDDE